MPYKSKEIRVSVKPKVNNDPLSWRVVKVEEGVRVLYGRERGKPDKEIYSYRFSRGKFNRHLVTEWLETHGIKEYLPFPPTQDLLSR